MSEKEDWYSGFYSFKIESETVVLCYKFESMLCKHLPRRSLISLPRFSPLMVTLVPGGPSFGETPVTKGIPAVILY